MAIPHGPKHIRVLDFDQRIVNAINRFAKLHGYKNDIVAELYNVAHPLPEQIIGSAEAIYTNPPWGASNGGESVRVFVQRGLEALNEGGLAAVVVANDPALLWTQLVLRRTQLVLLQNGFVIELGAQRHHYHLDDDPNLQSCTIVAKRVEPGSVDIASRRLSLKSRKNFYGRNRHLRVKYVLERLEPAAHGAVGGYELMPL